MIRELTPTTATPATTPTTTPTPAADILARTRAATAPALDRALRQLHPWLYEMATHTPDGKGIRAALTLLAAEAVGATGATAVPGAVAVELVQTFSLVHDDIMDGDEHRRARPAVWKAYGTGPAVLAGDALHSLALDTLAAGGGPHTATAVRHLIGALRDLVHGQAEDLRFEHAPWRGEGAVTPHAYLGMAGRKTGALFGCATALGAALGGAPPRTVDALRRAGLHAGVAFQAIDDVLGIWGDPAVTGKPVYGDLRRGKKTLPVLLALAGDRADARALAAVLGTDPFGDEHARYAAALIEAAGGRAAALAEADRQLALAHRSLRAVPLAPAPAGEIRSLLSYLTTRRG
ncbi:polyprenyl synthetase family protein [Streptomyces xiamenensis]|uniref:polyprenyl synthetase family protein n=1 Tax=Streptomyces TaxID=1883 RepID=UPI000694A618|nr:polyprenyl synthetase family protein [Streptomyces sp. NRRL F-2890]